MKMYRSLVHLKETIKKGVKIVINYILLEGVIKDDPQLVKTDKFLKIQFRLDFTFYSNKKGHINCNIWNEKAGELAFLEKGMKIIAAGQLVPLEWSNKKTGLKSYGVEFRITDVRKIV